LQRKHKIIKGALFLLSGKISNLIIQGLQILLIPRLLGPKNMGFYSYWLSIYFIIARVLGLGGQYIIIKYVPELRIRNKFMIPSLIKKVIWMKIPVFLFIMGIGILYWPNELAYFMIIALAALLFSLNLAGESILYSYNWMGTYALIPVIRIASRTALVIFLFYFFYATGIILGLFAAPLVAFLLSLFLSFRLLPRNQVALDSPFRKYLSFGFWMYMSQAILGMLVWLITILSKMSIGDMAVVGYFGVGVQICFSVILLVYFINESILPSLVEFHALEENKFKDSLRYAWKYTNILLFPVILGGYVLAQPIITFLVGRDYVPGTLIIKLFLPAVIFFSWIRFHNQVLFVYEKKIAIFLTQLINLFVFLGAWFYMMHLHEFDLAPLSLSLGAFVAYLFILFHSNKVEKVKNYFAHLFKPFMAASLMALVVRFFKVNSVTQLFLAALASLLLYGLFLFLFRGIGKEDFSILKEFLKSVNIFGVDRNHFREP
jgi:O-antigen/teichoic acid export membrane protein